MLSKRQFAGIMVLAVMAIVANHERLLPYRWRMYASPDGTFIGQFPGKPEVEDEQMQMADGRSTVLHQISVQPSKSTSYMCAYFDDPRLANASPEQVLDATLKGSAAKVQGSILAQRSLVVNSHPVREAEVQVHGGTILEIRVIVVGGRTFMLMVVDMARARPETTNVQRFFDSAKFAN